MTEVSWMESRLTALLRRMRGWASRKKTIAGRPPLPAEVPDDKLYRYMFNVGCPSCRGKPHWMKGPEGGMSVNIFCGHCGEGWNVTPLLERAEKIGKNTAYIEDAPSLVPGPFVCPRCRAVSHNRKDKEEGYCGRCHDFTGRRSR